MRRITVLILTVTIFTVSLCACSKMFIAPNEVQIKSICELATFKCYYNNVAKSEKKQGEGIEHWLEKDRVFWVEYKGVANIGIDVSKVKMKINGNNITITIPPAKLLSTDVISDSYKYVLSEDSFFNKNEITVKDQKSAILDAEKEMVNSVSNNSELLAAAQERAKELIENYIKNIGELIDVEYEITWKEI